MPLSSKKSAAKNFIWLVFPLSGICFFLLLAWFALYSTKMPDQTTPAPSSTATSNTFTASDVMGGFTIDVPEGFTAEQKFATVFLKKQNAEILITFIGVNEKSLKEHVETNPELKQRNIAYLQTNDLEAGVELKNQEKAYYIYHEYALYSLFTTSSELYSDLDQVFQSFRLSSE